MPTSPDSVSYTSVTAAMIGPPVVATGLVAAGSTQADATPIYADEAVFATVPVGAGAILRDKSAQIDNRGAADLLIYPQLGAQIESYGTNIAVTVPAGGSATFLRVSPTQYRVR